MTRTITIIVKEHGGFDVFEGERYCDHLCWDEMLGTIAELTHPKIGVAHYCMWTPDEYQAHEERRKARAAHFKMQPDGHNMLVTADGKRSIFDDVDE